MPKTAAANVEWRDVLPHDLGEHLIFVLSLPRSGSTLLQHILAGHSSVGATAEPWLLFPAILGLQQGSLKTDYNAHIGEVALRDFVSQLEGGDEEYYRAVRKMAIALYDRFLVQHGRQRFLDKTSRYYQVLPELTRVFPKARYVFLVRNPLATLASFLNVMVSDNWRRLGEPGIRHDLLDGYRLMRRGIRRFGDAAVLVRYEDLVASPEKTVVRLCGQLDLTYQSQMLDYGDTVGVLSGKLVDPRSIRRHKEVVPDYLHSWQASFQSAPQRYLGRCFLQHLGRDLITSLGYPFDELLDAVAGRNYFWMPVASWDTLTTAPPDRSWLEVGFLEFCERRRKLGTARAGISAIASVTGKLAKTAIGGARSIARRCGARRLVPVAHDILQGVRAFACGLKGWASGPVSSGHRVVPRNALHEETLDGWNLAEVAQRQDESFRVLLEEMYSGNPREDLEAAGEALRLTGLDTPCLLEVGCGSGYYSEVLPHLTRRTIRYAGLDYSSAMIDLARRQYADRSFVVGSATCLPFPDRSFDIVWAGTVMMHLPDYADAIREMSRVSGRWCVFHSTPVVIGHPTTYLVKNAYGGRVSEVIVNREEFEGLLRANGLSIRHTLESLPYHAGRAIPSPMETLTYVCRLQNG